MDGQKLTPNEVNDLEATVAKNPDDLSARTKLLGYYLFRQFSSQEAKEAHQKHVLWIIKNHPEAVIAGLPFSGISAIPNNDDAYNQGKQLWLEQTRAFQ